MITQSISLHEDTGRIAWLWVLNAFTDQEPYIGSFPWQWIDEPDRARVKVALALSLLGEPQTVRYQLDVAIHRGHWTVDTTFVRLPTQELPLIGISRTFSSVAQNLSPRERQIARLLPEMSSKKIAKELDISTSTVESFRSRLGIKLGRSGHQLLSWCQEHRDLL